MPETPWLDENQQHAWRSFLRMHAQLAARLHRDLQEESGLSLSDFEVLVQLTDVPGGRLRAFELARALQWEPSRLSHHLRRMEARGLVLREECPDDGRGAFVVLTPAGRAAIEAAAPAHVATVRRLVFDGLGDDEVEALARIADRVLARLAEDHRERRPAGADGRGDPGLTRR